MKKTSLAIIIGLIFSINLLIINDSYARHPEERVSIGVTNIVDANGSHPTGEQPEDEAQEIKGVQDERNIDKFRALGLFIAFIFIVYIFYLKSGKKKSRT